MRAIKQYSENNFCMNLAFSGFVFGTHFSRQSDSCTSWICFYLSFVFSFLSLALGQISVNFTKIFKFTRLKENKFLVKKLAF